MINNTKLRKFFFNFITIVPVIMCKEVHGLTNEINVV